MNRSITKQTLVLMLLSMLFGGAVIYLFGPTRTETLTTVPLAQGTRNQPAKQLESDPSNAPSSMPKGHPDSAHLGLTTKAAKSSSMNAGSIEDLTTGLRIRLEADPRDMKGWVLLAKSYQHLGQAKAAQTAAQKALELGYKGDILTGMNTFRQTANPHLKIRQNQPSYLEKYFSSKKPVSTEE